MNKRIARKLIKEQRISLTPEELNNQWWLDKTHVYITTIFGDNSQSLAIPMYLTYYHLEPDILKATASVKRINELFDTYLVMVDNGIYYKKNIFSNSSNLAIFGIMTSILIFSGGILSSIMFWEGQRSSNVTNIELQKEITYLKNRHLNDSLSIFKYEQNSENKSKSGNK